MRSAHTEKTQKRIANFILQHSDTNTGACPLPGGKLCQLTLKVLVATIDAQWDGIGDVGSARY